jgi:hypothetical protein
MTGDKELEQMVGLLHAVARKLKADGLDNEAYHVASAAAGVLVYLEERSVLANKGMESS